ncbi:MAG: glutaminyl-peptide cyclotransferase, partial [Betaproteobacteria bacterium]|nr:glutaminyl-peptide cyclotransferase [Betaproteobacteria bacterium]
MRTPGRAALPLLLAGLVGLASAGCLRALGQDLEGADASGSGPVQRLRVEVLGVLPHDRSAFTQGLVWHDDVLYESTGLRGRSDLRRVERGSGRVEQRVSLEPALFGEGLALVDDRLVMLTWQEHLARVFDRHTFETVAEFSYAG